MTGDHSRHLDLALFAAVVAVRVAGRHADIFGVLAGALELL